MPFRQEHVATARNFLNDIVSATREGNFDATPSEEACHDCGFKPLCESAWGTDAPAELASR